MLEDEQVPGIPQEVRLFGEDKHAEPQRKEALLEWFRDEMREDESVLVLCRGAPTAKSLFRDPVFKEIDGGTLCATATVTSASGKIIRALSGVRLAY